MVTLEETRGWLKQGEKAIIVWCRLSLRAPDDTDTLAIRE